MEIPISVCLGRHVETVKSYKVEEVPSFIQSIVSKFKKNMGCKFQANQIKALISLTDSRVLRPTGKVWDQVSKGDRIWVVTNAEWDEYQNTHLQAEPLMRNGKVLVQRHPAFLSHEKLMHFILQHHSDATPRLQRRPLSPDPRGTLRSTATPRSSATKPKPVSAVTSPDMTALNIVKKALVHASPKPTSPFDRTLRMGELRSSLSPNVPSRGFTSPVVARVNIRTPSELHANPQAEASLPVQSGPTGVSDGAGVGVQPDDSLLSSMASPEYTHPTSYYPPSSYEQQQYHQQLQQHPLWSDEPASHASHDHDLVSSPSYSQSQSLLDVYSSTYAPDHEDVSTDQEVVDTIGDQSTYGDIGGGSVNDLGDAGYEAAVGTAYEEGADDEAYQVAAAYDHATSFQDENDDDNVAPSTHYDEADDEERAHYDSSGLAAADVSATYNWVEPATPETAPVVDLSAVVHPVEDDSYQSHYQAQDPSLSTAVDQSNISSCPPWSPPPRSDVHVHDDEPSEDPPFEDDEQPPIGDDDDDLPPPPEDSLLPEPSSLLDGSHPVLEDDDECPSEDPEADDEDGHDASRSTVEQPEAMSSEVICVDVDPSRADSHSNEVEPVAEVDAVGDVADETEAQRWALPAENVEADAALLSQVDDVLASAPFEASDEEEEGASPTFVEHTQRAPSHEEATNEVLLLGADEADAAIDDRHTEEQESLSRDSSDTSMSLHRGVEDGEGEEEELDDDVATEAIAPTTVAATAEADAVAELEMDDNVEMSLSPHEPTAETSEDIDNGSTAVQQADLAVDVSTDDATRDDQPSSATTTDADEVDEANVHSEVVEAVVATAAEASSAHDEEEEVALPEAELPAMEVEAETASSLENDNAVVTESLAVMENALTDVNDDPTATTGFPTDASAYISSADGDDRDQTAVDVEDDHSHDGSDDVTVDVGDNDDDEQLAAAEISSSFEEAPRHHDEAVEVEGEEAEADVDRDISAQATESTIEEPTAASTDARAADEEPFSTAETAEMLGTEAPAPAVEAGSAPALLTPAANVASDTTPSTTISTTSVPTLLPISPPLPSQSQIVGIASPTSSRSARSGETSPRLVPLVVVSSSNVPTTSPAVASAPSASTSTVDTTADGASTQAMALALQRKQQELDDTRRAKQELEARLEETRYLLQLIAGNARPAPYAADRANQAGPMAAVVPRDIREIEDSLRYIHVDRTVGSDASALMSHASPTAGSGLSISTAFPSSASSVAASMTSPFTKNVLSPTSHHRRQQQHQQQQQQQQALLQVPPPGMVRLTSANGSERSKSNDLLDEVELKKRAFRIFPAESFDAFDDHNDNDNRRTGGGNGSNAGGAGGGAGVGSKSPATAASAVAMLMDTDDSPTTLSPAVEVLGEYSDVDEDEEDDDQGNEDTRRRNRDARDASVALRSLHRRLHDMHPQSSPDTVDAGLVGIGSSSFEHGRRVPAPSAAAGTAASAAAPAASTSTTASASPRLATSHHGHSSSGKSSQLLKRIVSMRSRRFAQMQQQQSPTPGKAGPSYRDSPSDRGTPSPILTSPVQMASPLRRSHPVPTRVHHKIVLAKASPPLPSRYSRLGNASAGHHATGSTSTTPHRRTRADSNGSDDFDDDDDDEEDEDDSTAAAAAAAGAAHVPAAAATPAKRHHPVPRRRRRPRDDLDIDIDDSASDSSSFPYESTPKVRHAYRSVESTPAAALLAAHHHQHQHPHHPHHPHHSATHAHHPPLHPPSHSTSHAHPEASPQATEAALRRTSLEETFRATVQSPGILDEVNNISQATPSPAAAAAHRHGRGETNEGDDGDGRDDPSDASPSGGIAMGFPDDVSTTANSLRETLDGLTSPVTPQETHDTTGSDQRRATQRELRHIASVDSVLMGLETQRVVEEGDDEEDNGNGHDDHRQANGAEPTRDGPRDENGSVPPSSVEERSYPPLSHLQSLEYSMSQSQWDMRQGETAAANNADEAGHVDGTIGSRRHDNGMPPELPSSPLPVMVDANTARATSAIHTAGAGEESTDEDDGDGHGIPPPPPPPPLLSTVTVTAPPTRTITPPPPPPPQLPAAPSSAEAATAAPPSSASASYHRSPSHPSTTTFSSSASAASGNALSLSALAFASNSSFDLLQQAAEAANETNEILQHPPRLSSRRPSAATVATVTRTSTAQEELLQAIDATPTSSPPKPAAHPSPTRPSPAHFVFPSMHHMPPSSTSQSVEQQQQGVNSSRDQLTAEGVAASSSSVAVSTEPSPVVDEVSALSLPESEFADDGNGGDEVGVHAVDDLADELAAVSRTHAMDDANATAAAAAAAIAATAAARATPVAAVVTGPPAPPALPLVLTFPKEDVVGHLKRYYYPFLVMHKYSLSPHCKGSRGRHELLASITEWELLAWIVFQLYGASADALIATRIKTTQIVRVLTAAQVTSTKSFASSQLDLLLVKIKTQITKEGPIAMMQAGLLSASDAPSVGATGVGGALNVSSTASSGGQVRSKTGTVVKSRPGVGVGGGSAQGKTLASHGNSSINGSDATFPLFLHVLRQLPRSPSTATDAAHTQRLSIAFEELLQRHPEAAACHRHTIEASFSASGVFLRSTAYASLAPSLVAPCPLHGTTVRMLKSLSLPAFALDDVDGVRVIWERNSEQLHQIYAFYATALEARRLALPGASAMKLQLSLENTKELLMDFGLLPQLVDVPSFHRLFRATKLWEWELAECVLRSARVYLQQQQQQQQPATPMVSQPGSPHAAMGASGTSVMGGMGMANNNGVGGLHGLLGAGSSYSLLQYARQSALSPASAGGGVGEGQASWLLVDMEQVPALTTLMAPQADPADMLGSLGHCSLSYPGFLELLARIAALNVSRLTATSARRQVSSSTSSSMLPLTETVENLLHVMDASEAKAQKLSRASRRSITVRHFVYANTR